MLSGLISLIAAMAVVLPAPMVPVKECCALIMGALWVAIEPAAYACQQADGGFVGAARSGPTGRESGAGRGDPPPPVAAGRRA